MGKVLHRLGLNILFFFTIVLIIICTAHNSSYFVLIYLPCHQKMPVRKVIRMGHPVLRQVGETIPPEHIQSE
jgi:hypothetical protein